VPELPEVETIKSQLDLALKGLKITGVEVLKEKSFVGKAAEVVGGRVVGVERRAKIFLIRLDNGRSLAVHLKMTGQLIFRPIADCQNPISEKEAEKDSRYDVGDLPNKYTRVVIDFDGGAKLFFNDLRIFGWMKVIGDSNFKLQSEKLGPEATDRKAFSAAYFKKILGGSRRSVKLVIMDQEKLAGVGNIYANEALFMAGIDPQKAANRLSGAEAAKLRKAVIEVLEEAIAKKGTTDRDDAFRQSDGSRGGYQKYLRVYGRKGEKCPRCGGKIERIKIGGRGTFYCSKCQH